MGAVPAEEQDFQTFLAQYRAARADDVLVFGDEVSPDQEVSAVVDTLERQGRRPLCLFENVRGLGVPVATNVFASRERIARLFGVPQGALHATYQARANRACAPRIVDAGPVCDVVQQDGIDLHTLPLLKHFETDRGPYITSAVIVLVPAIGAVIIFKPFGKMPRLKEVGSGLQTGTSSAAAATGSCLSGAKTSG